MHIRIVTERLTLEPLGPEYLDTVNRYALEPENTKYMCHMPYSGPEETMAFLRNAEREWRKDRPDYYEFAVLYQGVHIGAVSVYPEQDIGELGWIICRQYQGNGFAAEAASAMVRYFADHMGIPRFRAHCDTENKASVRIMEKLGMTRTGEWGGRRNRNADRDSSEYQYDLVIEKAVRYGKLS